MGCSLALTGNIFAQWSMFFIAKCHPLAEAHTVIGCIAHLPGMMVVRIIVIIKTTTATTAATART